MDNETNWYNIKEGVRKYTWIMDNVHKTDVSTDREFQRRFRHFYRVRLSLEKSLVLFDYLEMHKDKEVSFKQTVSYLYDQIGSLEASFSSKVVATINSNFPIWDRVISDIIGIQNPSGKLPKNERIDEANKSYQNIITWYDNLIKSDEGDKFVTLFNSKVGKTNITPIKKIDFILWQTRT